MIALRSLAFQVCFHAWTAVLGIFALPVLFAPRRIGFGVGRLWVDGIFGLLAHIVGMTYEVRGDAARPAGPAVYAFKHQSAWDALVLMRLFVEPAVVMKRELMHLPVLGWYFRHLGMIPIDRRAGATALRAMRAAARERIRDGRDIVVFPEGTRTPPGSRRAYHAGIAALYRDLSVPVVPVALDSGRYWGRRAFTRRPGRIVVSFLPPVAPGLDRETFMRRLQDSIEAECATLAAD